MVIMDMDRMTRVWVQCVRACVHVRMLQYEYQLCYLGVQRLYMHILWQLKL
jgi:hypothetical protein